jgi:hypothetical protein
MRKRILGLLIAIGLFALVTGVVLATAASITPQDVVRTAPIVPTYVAFTADGAEFANNGEVLLIIKNDDVSTHYFTVTTPATYYGMAVADLYFTITASGEEIAGPFAPNLYNDSDGDVAIAVSSHTSTTAAAIRY